jgi:hypothetical protein
MLWERNIETTTDRGEVLEKYKKATKDITHFLNYLIIIQLDTFRPR